MDALEVDALRTALDVATARAQKAEARLAALGVSPDGPPPTLAQMTTDKVIAAEAKTKEVYRERDQCVALIARLALCYGLRAGLGRHPDGEGWDWDWMTIVFIDLPSGQVSWHVHDSEVWMFQALPKYTAPWDGHDTDLKYRRVMSSGLDAHHASLMKAATAIVETRLAGGVSVLYGLIADLADVLGRADIATALRQAKSEND